ncbi:NAD-dependent epimerase/dehydratase family protein [candidate division KSB1 bacterium]|nr:NAD-dependent epimerase/dehydratase family protein [candidate division KSB1 bacterium]
MKLLVTGGAGFIGSHLVEHLLARGNVVHCLDDFNDYYSPAIKYNNIKESEGHTGFTLYKGDILDTTLLETLFQQNSYDAVIHLAARAGVRPSIQQPGLYAQVNIQGTMNLLECCRKYQVGKFIYASSSSVYGANKKVPFSENDFVDHPISPYAATKKATELITHTYHHLYGIQATGLRFFTVYGPRQRPDMAIHKFAQMIYRNQPIPVFGKGNSRRDYTYIDDIIQGILASVECCNGYHIYNLGESSTIELLDLIELLQKAMGKKAKLDFQPEQPGDVPITYADITLARKDLNYDPQTLVKAGIEKFVEWFYANVHHLVPDKK